MEFADFQCPACKTLSISLKKIRDDYKDSVLFVFKNYPLDNSCNANITKVYHEYACGVAVMADVQVYITNFGNIMISHFRNNTI